MSTARNAVSHSPTKVSPADGWHPSRDNGFTTFGYSVLYAVIISAPILAFGGYLISSGIAERTGAEIILQERFRAHDRLITATPKEMLPLDQVVRGKALFESSCAACHKANGTGVEGLGKDLTQSWFITALDDAKLAEFIARGRAYDDPMNSTEVPMPPKGGHEELTESDLGHIAIYVRGLQDPRRLPELPASLLAAAPIAPLSESEKTAALAAAGGNAELAEYIASGTKLFGTTCAACHGKDARGVKSLGKDLINNEFCRKLDDDGLLAFIKRGRDPGDPMNTSKVGMPAKGGNPALSDDDLLDIISYMRSLQKQAGTTQ